MTRAIDTTALTSALDTIELGDPRVDALKSILPAIKEKIAAGAKVKQIVAVLAPNLGGNDAWLAKTLAGLLRKRGGGRKKTTTEKPPTRPRLAAAAE